MRDEKEERKKQARSNKQTRQSNTAHPRQLLFLEKNELPRVGLEPTTLYTCVCTVRTNSGSRLHSREVHGMVAQWVKLQSDIRHFPSIFGTCPTKNQYVLPICPNAQRVMNAHVRATRNTRPRRCAESA